MTVDIIQANGNALAAMGGANEALDRLGQWVTAAKNATQLVAPLVNTPFVPDAYRPKIDPRATQEEKDYAREVAVATATAAVLQGITLGLDPLTSLQQIYIVHGRPGMYTEMKVALLKSRGHDVWTEDLTDTRAVVCGRRAGTDYVERVTVTMEQARKAGWTKNDTYTKTPQDMLYARAAGRVCDRVAPDVLMGIASVEEIHDSIQATAEAGKATRTVNPPKKRGAPAIAAATAEDDPPLDEDPPTATAAVTPQDIDAEPMITPALSKKLHARLKAAGHGEQNAGLAHLSDALGRNVMSTKELTAAEAIQVIDGLEAAERGVPEPVLDPELEWPPVEQPSAAQPGQGVPNAEL